MNPVFSNDEITKRIKENPYYVFDCIRSNDLGTKLYGFIGFAIYIRENRISAELSRDFSIVSTSEYFPFFLSCHTPESYEALARSIEVLGTISEGVLEKDFFYPFIPIFVQCSQHISPKVVSSALVSLGRILGAASIHYPIEISGLFEKAFKSDIADIRKSAIDGVGLISVSHRDIAMEIAPAVYQLLFDPNSDVRLSAVGFFITQAKSAGTDVSFALPLLREMRENDPNLLVRERASATVNAILAKFDE